MGAETTVYVKRSRLVEEWVEVETITLYDGIKEVTSMESTFKVLDAQYDKPDEWGKEG